MHVSSAAESIASCACTQTIVSRSTSAESGLAEEVDTDKDKNKKKLPLSLPEYDYPVPFTIRRGESRSSSNRDSSARVVVKNTFVTCPSDQPFSSLFIPERNARSCPNSCFHEQATSDCEDADPVLNPKNDDASLSAVNDAAVVSTCTWSSEILEPARSPTPFASAVFEYDSAQGPAVQTSGPWIPIADNFATASPPAMHQRAEWIPEWAPECATEQVAAIDCATATKSCVEWGAEWVADWTQESSAEWIPTGFVALPVPPPPIESAPTTEDFPDLSEACTHAPQRQASAVAQVVCLADSLMQRNPSSSEMPTKGSEGHAEGTCRPCAFLHTKGCSKGVECQFCHLCPAGEKKRRQREKYAQLKEMKEQPSA